MDTRKASQSKLLWNLKPWQLILIFAVLCLLGAIAAYILLRQTSSPPNVVESIEQLPSVSDASDLSWSPDGRTILYASSSAIWRIDSDGGNQTYLSDGRYPTWSPDGSKIAFVTDNGLEVMNADGNERKVLVNKAEMAASPLLPYANLASTTWSPDGGMIAFQVEAYLQQVSDGSGQTVTEIADIWVVNADGSNLRQLTTDPARDWNPVWSPNSQMIAFISDRSGSGWDIWITHFDGTGLQQLTTNTATDWDPSWSPDGSRIAFASTEGEDDLDIWVMDADGGNKIELITGSESYDHPMWSPDGSEIAFDSTRLGPLGDIWIVKLDGNEKTRLTKSSSSWFTCQRRWVRFQEPKWSPDGGKLLFLSGLREGNEVWSYDKVWVLELKQENSDSG